MNKKILSMAMILSFAYMPCAFADESYAVQQATGYQTQYPLPVNSYQTQGYGYNNYDQLQGNVTLVPANTTFTATTMSPIDSEVLRTGDNVTLYLSSDFYYGSKLIAAAGSRINGTVLNAKKGSFGSRNGQVHIKFTNIVTPYGQMIPISASIQTDDGSGILKAGTAKDVTKEYAKDVGIGAASGAVLGTAMGALSSGSVGRGAIYGTALGGGLGLIKSFVDKGGNVEIPQGVQLNIVTDQPITVASNSPY